jgi:hypothetical protein
MTTDVKRTYNPSQTFHCSLPSCGREFKAPPSDRRFDRAYCCHAHAAQDRERRLGHGTVTMPCGTCDKPVTRSASQMPGRTAYCNKECWGKRGKAPLCDP